MKRRSFLKGAAAVMPAVAVPEWLLAQALGQAAAAPGAGELHLVGASDDRFGHPHSLGFSTFYFKVSGAETGGRLFLMEHQQMKAGGGPNLHLHLNQEEWFYVIEGEVAFQVGEQRLRLKAGESVLAPRQVPHTFSAVGPEPARMMIGFCPAGKMEQYFLDKGDPHAAVRNAAFYELKDVGPSPFWKA
ncbi:MAG TPA: cupin domain-containing protein [Acidobacteriaceae bacterium]|nr:cupin domain-containing protein [Acidobacteriaceae bacterium]